MLCIFFLRNKIFVVSEWLWRESIIVDLDCFFFKLDLYIGVSVVFFDFDLLFWKCLLFKVK